MSFPDDLRYSKEHEWARVEGDRVTVGITEYAQGELGEIVYVELPEVGAEVEHMETFGTVESVKAVSDLYAPVSGEVIEVNEALEDEPGLINTDSYGDGWMVVVEMSDPDELADMMTAEEYATFIEEME
jgi:glycine cleavage system H protein